jgi:hypothetical protein
MVEMALYALLNDVPAITGRVFPVTAPEACTAPYATYEKTGGGPYEIMTGWVRLQTADFTIDVFAKTYAVAKTIAASVTAKLQALQFTAFGGVAFQSVSFDEDSPETFDSIEDLYTKTINITIIFSEV